MILIFMILIITIIDVIYLVLVNHMFGLAIWDKLPECIYENFEIARLKWG